MNKNIYHIASDYFNGHISESDLHFLQSWLAESKENKKLLNELEQIWKITGEFSFKLNPDIDAEWDLFMKKRKEGIVKKIEPAKILKIAAILIPAFLVLSIFLVYLFKNGKSSEMITINTSDGRKDCILPDGTKVLLNANSILNYPTEFADRERVVKLEGEAFFEVVKNDLPFKIITDKTQITVVGTEFNVRAIKQENFTEVVVSKGTVIFKELASNKGVTLVAGQLGTHNSLTNELNKEEIPDLNLIGWKTGILSFQDTPLREIETILSRYYHVKIQIDSSLKQCKFTGEFKQAQLDEILKVISISVGATYQEKNNTIFIEGKGCKD